MCEDTSDFDFENNDLLDDTFRDIPDSDLIDDDDFPRCVSRNAETNSISCSFINESGFESPSSYKNEKHSSLTSNKGVPCSSFSQNGAESSTNYCSKSQNEKKMIDSRFVPGYTPKPKEPEKPNFLKYCIQLMKNETKERKASIKADFQRNKNEIDLEDIPNSQFVGENVHLETWERLQQDVSSCQSLFKVAKYYSIRRVLHEASLMKLPKFMEVPVLCVSIQKFDEDHMFSVIFEDDTGKVTGRINKEVFSLYKEHLIVGTAFILKKVKFVLNVLILKLQNIVSFYVPNIPVKRLQDLNFISELGDINPLQLSSYKPPSNQSIAKDESTEPQLVQSLVVVNNTEPEVLVPSLVEEDVSTNLVEEERLVEEDNLGDFDELMCQLDEQSFLDEF